VTGHDLRNARPTIDENNQPAVGFTLTPEGGRKFGKVTSENIGRQLANHPRRQGAVGAAARGQDHDRWPHPRNFTQEEVQNLGLILRSGALPASLTYLQEHTIGPSLGKDSIRSGVLASLVGLLAVVAFMLVYYKLSGVNAVIALLFNLVILIGLMAYIGAVMTLPGIAGFVLTMGIGVDSNVLISSASRRSSRRSAASAPRSTRGSAACPDAARHAHRRAHLGRVLFQFGTGPIRGFAVTLSVGLLSNLFTSIFVSKTLFELALARRQQVATLSI